MSTQTFTGTLVIEECCKCHVAFGMTAGLQKARLNDKETFYCPNGHPQHYVGQTDADLLRAQVKRLESSRDSALRSERWWRERAEHERRSAAAQKGHRTRVLNLIARGVCPVGGCRRNFTNVREHMATVHPDFHAHEDGAS